MTIIVVIAFSVFIYVFLISEIKRMNREKIIKQEILTERINKLEMYLVEVQKLTSESRIVSLAQDSLGLSRPEKNIEIISVSKNQIIQVENFIKGKYD
ncbi:MAG: cell division protein FtsL [Melioribacteraceae bacterium]|nr:cell division protein FtsL [Melioribacteraceae bacterium]